MALILSYTGWLRFFKRPLPFLSWLFTRSPDFSKLMGNHQVNLITVAEDAET